jgi:hypothetical protein
VSLQHEVEDFVPHIITDNDVPSLLKKLGTLGFKPDQSQKAVDFLSKPSPLAYSLFDTLSPLEACIQYLILHVPECDLPERFMPSINSSNPFVTGGHSGDDDIKKRWIEDKMVKEGGWPSHVVKTAIEQDPSLAEDQRLLTINLCSRLLGNDAALEASDGNAEDVDSEELDSLGGKYAEPGHLIIPLPIAPFKLHIFLSAGQISPLNRPAVYISSDSVPSYIRLHILTRLLSSAADGTLVDQDETFLGACMRVIEEGWVDIEVTGPPDVSDVLHHLMPRRKLSAVDVEARVAPIPVKEVRKGRLQQRGENRSDAQIKEQFEALCRQQKFNEILAARQKLPAFFVKDHFLSTLEKNRVVVVVGETGKGSQYSWDLCSQIVDRIRKDNAM